MNIIADRFYDILVQKGKVIGLFLMLLLVPISYTAGDARKFQETAMLLAGMSYASLFFGSIWLTLFFILNILLFIWNGCAVGSTQVLNVFIGCVLFAASRSFFQQRGITILISVFKILVAINVCWIILQIFRIDPLFIAKNAQNVPQWGVSFDMPAGLFHYQAAMGMLFCLAMPFFFFSGPIIPLFLLVPVSLSSSSACYLTAATMIVYGFFYIRMVTFKRRIVYWILGFIVISTGIFGVYRDYSVDRLTGNSRFENWHLFLKSGLNYPIFGYGPDSFRNTTKHKDFNFSSDEDYNPLLMKHISEKQVVAKYHSADEGKRISRFKDRTPKTFADWREAHNEYIQIFFEYGLLGLTLIGLFFYEVFLRFKLSSDSKEVRVLFGAIICYLVFSTTQFPLHLARLVIFLPVILGAFFAHTDKDWDTFAKGGSS